MPQKIHKKKKERESLKWLQLELNWPVWPNEGVFVYELSGSGFKSSCSLLTFRFVPASSKEFPDIQATVERGFTLKHIRDMTRT